MAVSKNGSAPAWCKGKHISPAPSTLQEVQNEVADLSTAVPDVALISTFLLVPAVLETGAGTEMHWLEVK